MKGRDRSKVQRSKARAEPQRISKLDAAERQLITAVRLFFNNGDAVAVLTLAGAAAEVLETLCTKECIDPFSSGVLSDNPHLTKKHYYDLRNQYRNFFKHGDKPPDEIDFSDELNDIILFICSHDLGLLKRMPPESQAINLWYPAMQPHRLSDKKFEPLLGDIFPRLASLPRHRQKKMGLDLLDWLHSEPGLLGKQPWLGADRLKKAIR